MASKRATQTPKANQPTLSSFFKPPQPKPQNKRPLSPIDLTQDEDLNTERSDAPPTKKARITKSPLNSPPDHSSESQQTRNAGLSSGSITLNPSGTVSMDHRAGHEINFNPSESSGPISRKARTHESMRKWGHVSSIQNDPAVSGVMNDAAISSQRDISENVKSAARDAFRNKLLVRAARLEQRQALPSDETYPRAGSETAKDEDDESRPQRLEKRPSKGTRKIKEVDTVGPSGQKWTPLEKQILALKAEHQGVLLLVEVGYKYRFFGEDAQVASRELGIACFPDRNFLTASIPVHRRGVHVKKLISQGYKVGVVGQAETAALKKAGDNRNTPFLRQLTNLYTAATFVDELESIDDIENSSPSSSNSLVCLVEELRGGMGADERVSIGMFSVVPAVGDIVYDEFLDLHMRTELETRLAHIDPCELLLPDSKLSNATEKMLSHWTGTTSSSSSSKSRNRVRVERFSDRMSYTQAFDFVTEFYENQGGKSQESGSSNLSSSQLMATVVDLPKSVVIALAHSIKHLGEFPGLSDIFLQSTFFTKFGDRAHMLLNGNTLSNLEIYQNQTDFTEKGSLVNVLDRTKTRFGARLFRSWIGRPLTDKRILQDRLDAVDEILNDQSPALDILRSLLKGLPDLVKGLCRIQYGKATPKELATILIAYQKIGNAFDRQSQSQSSEFNSSLLQDILAALPTAQDPMANILGIIDLRQAATGEKYRLWLDDSKYPAIEETKSAIVLVEEKLEVELKEARKILGKPSLKWTAVSGVEYLAEVKNGEKQKVPASWTHVSSTKVVTRFHTPTAKTHLAEKEQLKEKLVQECDKAFALFLGEISAHYSVLRDVTNKLAVFDCLNSLAQVATLPGYIKPEFVEEDILNIIDGRHPMVEVMRSDPFVPNTLQLGGEQPRHMIITGPNMGGKSSCVRMTALIAIMAQIGSYVPASKAQLGLHDGVLTRMGASDELARGRSTFMVEISETSDIIATATPRTLVILDELGRGTSTFDGMSIAYAVMQHLVESIRCQTLFITHYPLLAVELGKRADVANGHMGFIEEDSGDGMQTINFLYRLLPGIARGSFGIECAKLAGMPESILRVAKLKSASMQELIEERGSVNKMRKALTAIRGCVGDGCSNDQIMSLKALCKDLGDTR